MPTTQLHGFEDTQSTDSRRFQLSNLMIFGHTQAILDADLNRFSQQNLTILEGIAHKNQIRKPDTLVRLLKALALRLCDVLSYSELGLTIGADKNTVHTYLKVLEAEGLILQITPIANQKNVDIASGRKIYFHNIALRNALLTDFRPLELRQDCDALWENFLVIERRKYLHQQNISFTSYFWRNNRLQTIDYTEKMSGQYFAYQIRWGNKDKAAFASSFTKAYDPLCTKVLTPRNFEHFLGIVRIKPLNWV
jgi:uncharacterized protein